MALLLHLSDLHLTPNDADDVVGDYKVNVIPASQRQTRRQLLEQTLSGLARHLKTSRSVLDAVVVSGDITYQGDRRGFELLPDVLALLKGVGPPPERVVVVPGNHDVAWGTPPSSTARYAAFIETVGTHGYCLALLPGAGPPWDSPHEHGPLVVDANGRFSIIAVNSADYCGVIEPLSDAAITELKHLEAADDAVALRDELDRLRLYDVARVAPDQLNALRDILDNDRSADGRRPVRIAVLHHQLLPVSPAEEFKPFEGLTNLGEVRRFLGGNEIDLVLHGHKHVAGLYEDRFPVADNATGTDQDHRVIVCSAGTTGPGAAAGTEVAKLIEIIDDLPTLRRVRVTSLRAPSGGAPLRLADAPSRDLPIARPPHDWAVTSLVGSRASEIHEQLLETFSDGTRRRDILCRWSQGDSAFEMPPTYPAERIDGDPNVWFAETVAWWQSAERAPGKPWTHGQRIRDWGSRVDQVHTAVEALNQELDTSRAVITLLSPQEDRVADYAEKFPAFVMAHFWVADGALHGAAWFRKQEMRYWWPINAAELATLQRDLLGELEQRGRTLVAGSLMTFTSQAVVGDSPPKVAVPGLDRAAWENEGAIWRLALAIFDDRMPGRDEELQALTRYMRDWTPADRRPPDGPPIPGRGLDILSAAVGALQERYCSAEGAVLLGLLRSMAERNENYREKSEKSKQPAQTYGRWRKASAADIDSFADVVERLKGHRPCEAPLES